MFKKIALITCTATLILFFQSCTKHDDITHKQKETLHLKELDTKKIEEIIGIKGTVSNGEFKVTIPQNDLKVKVDGFKIIPPMGLASWAAFTPSPGGAMVMGDLVLTEKDIKPVEEEIIKQGLAITGIHNHFIRNEPNVMFMHIGGEGSAEDLAQKVKEVFSKINEVRGENPSSIPADSVVNTIDTAMISGTLKYFGQMSKGVYKVTIGRPDVDLVEHGAPVSTFLGFNTWAAWQGTNEKAAVAGDFVMLDSEVEKVVKILVENGIEVVALHNHMIHEEPKVFFLHYWGIGPAEKLAAALRKALDQT